MAARPVGLAPILALLLAPLAAADVLVVDPSGAGDHTTLVAAVGAAVDGDLLLVKAGSYNASLDIDDKALVIQAEAGATPRVRSPVTVQGLSASKTVVLRGLEIRTVSSDALLIKNNAGQVRVEDCEIRSGKPLGNGTVVRFSEAVSFLRCTIDGAIGTNSCSGCVGGGDIFPGPGGVALTLLASDVSFSDCVIKGGTGGSDNDLVGWTGSSGGRGMEVVGGTVFLTGSSLSGGAGGTGGCEPPISIDDTCYDGGNGGAGLRIREGALVRQLGTQIAGGPGGPPGGPPGFDGAPGADVVVQDTADLLTLTGAARSFEASSPVREGGSVSLDVTGLPGDAVMVWGSLSAGYVSLPEYGGVFLLGFPLLQPAGVFVGLTDVGGVLHVDVPVAELGPGIPGIAAHLQATFVETGGSLLALGPSTTIVLLDGMF